VGRKKQTKDDTIPESVQIMHRRLETFYELMQRKIKDLQNIYGIEIQVSNKNQYGLIMDVKPTLDKDIYTDDELDNLMEKKITFLPPGYPVSGNKSR
jgi:hypothetical protein